MLVHWTYSDNRCPAALQVGSPHFEGLMVNVGSAASIPWTPPTALGRIQTSARRRISRPQASLDPAPEPGVFIAQAVPYRHDDNGSSSGCRRWQCDRSRGRQYPDWGRTRHEPRGLSRRTKRHVFDSAQTHACQPRPLSARVVRSGGIERGFIVRTSSTWPAARTAHLRRSLLHRAKGEPNDRGEKGFGGSVSERGLCRTRFPAHWMETIDAIVANVGPHGEASGIFATGEPEGAIAWINSATGIKCKIRID